MTGRPGIRDQARLLRDRTLLAFLFICFLHWLSYAPYDLLFGCSCATVGCHPVSWPPRWWAERLLR